MVRWRLFALTAKQVEKTTKPGYYGDGGGLTLQVLPSGAKTWIFRFMLNGRAREMGLGGVATFSLAEARERARAARQLVQDGRDPIEARREALAERVAGEARQVKFRDAAAMYIDAHEPGWRNAKHAYQWRQSLEAFANPIIGDMHVSAVQTAEVMRVLGPIWKTKNETAQRVRGRIENILDWCKVQGSRSGENPARWKGHLDKLLPKPSKVAPGENHPALPWQQMPAFMQALRQRSGVSARALEFIVLTAARSGEARGARWKEVDLDARVWHVPADRMKAGRAHDVPLSDAVVELLSELRVDDADGLIFKGRGGKLLSDMSVLAVIRRMNEPELIWKDIDGRPALVHGMRATFRMWAAEATNFPRDVAEHALAHQLPDRVEAAYQRSTVFKKRGALMAEWATYCTTNPALTSETPTERT